MSTLSKAADDALERTASTLGWSARHFRPREFFGWAYRDATPEAVPWCERFLAGAEVFPPCSADAWEAVWRSMQRIALELDKLRDELGPLRITPAGGVRFEAVHPLKHAEAPGSRHFIGDAADVVPLRDGVTAADVFALADREQRNGGMTPGGAHAYASGFCHIDARSIQARW